MGTFLVVQWLRLHVSTSGGMGLIPGWGTKITHAAGRGQKKKKNHNKCKWIEFTNQKTQSGWMD